MTRSGSASPNAEFQKNLVYKGRDGWLFLKGGSNFVTTLYAREGGNLPDSKLAEWRNAIERRTARCRELGIACVHLIVPEKLTIYGDLYAASLVDPDLSPAKRLAELMVGSPAEAAFLDLVPCLRERRDDEQLYWRTDTHWSPEGCFAAYKALCARLNLRPEERLLKRPHETDILLMDLGGRVEPQQWEQVREYDYTVHARRAWVNRVTRLLEEPAYEEEIHVGARARFLNPMAINAQNVLLFGDSYSGPSSDSFTGMLAESFRSLEFVWSSQIDWALVESSRPDILVFEIAERFLAAIPDDTLNLRQLELRQSLRAYRRRLQRWRRARESHGAGRILARD